MRPRFFQLELHELIRTPLPGGSYHAGGPKIQGIFGATRRVNGFFVASLSGLSGLHPALPPMAESLGALSSTKFDGEVIENEKRRC